MQRRQHKCAGQVDDQKGGKISYDQLYGPCTSAAFLPDHYAHMFGIEVQQRRLDTEDRHVWDNLVIGIAFNVRIAMRAGDASDRSVSGPSLRVFRPTAGRFVVSPLRRWL